jgi:hypothetical protein
MVVRCEVRLEANEPVDVILLGERETKVLGRITNYSSRGLGMLIGRPVPLGAIVKLEWNHTVLLGEVRHCRADGDGFAIGLKLQNPLCVTRELEVLAQRLLTEIAAEETEQAKEIEK